MLSGHFDKWRIFDSITSGVVVQDSEGGISYANSAAKNLLGLSIQEMQRILDGSSEFLVYGDDERLFGEEKRPAPSVLKTGEPIQDLVVGLEEPGKTRKWFLFNSHPLCDLERGTTNVITTFVDITERKEAEEGLRRMNRALKVLSESNQALVRAADEMELLQSICQIIVEAGGYPMAWVGYAEPDGEKRVVPQAVFGKDDGYLERAYITWKDVERGRGPVGTSIRTGETKIIRDIATDSAAIPWRAAALERGYASIFSSPLRDHDQVFGVLTIYAKERDSFDPEEVQLLEELANDLSYGILSLRARDERRKAREALKYAQFALDQSSDAIYWVDKEGGFKYVNEAACRSLDYRQDELLTLKIWDIDPLFTPKRWSDHWEQIKQSSATAFETVHRTKDGRNFPVEVTGDFHGFNGQEIHCVFVRDITERQRVETALRENEEKFRSLVEHTSDWFWELDPENRLSYTSPRVLEFLGFTENEVLGKTPFELMPADEAERLRKPLSQLLTGKKELKLFENTLLHKDGSLVFIETNGSPVYDERGLFKGYRGTNRDVTARRRTEQELTHSLSRLRRSVEETIQAMAKMLEIRDPYTAGHQRRVAQLVKVVAETMGLSSDEIEGVYLAAVIHDIGKIYTPAEILSKPGKITAIEFSMIQTHPRVGYEILKPIEFPWPIADIVLQHHERLDGSGYPNGLTGDAILPGARILSVADVVEAMASHRPYRPALGIDKALQEVVEHRGSLYDPHVVDVCVEIFREKGFVFDPQ